MVLYLTTHSTHFIEGYIGDMVMRNNPTILQLKLIPKQQSTGNSGHLRFQNIESYTSSPAGRSSVAAQPHRAPVTSNRSLLEETLVCVVPDSAPKLVYQGSIILSVGWWDGAYKTFNAAINHQT